MRNYSAYSRARQYGYRSGLEVKLSQYLDDLKVKYGYESIKLSKGAKSTYGEWCTKHKLPYYDRIIPEDWLKEKGKKTNHPKLTPFNGTKIKRR